MAQLSFPTEAANTASASIQEAPEKRRSLRWYNIFLYLFLLLFTIAALGPFIFSLSSSFKTYAHILDFPPSLFPNPAILSNYVQLFQTDGFLNWILNSFVYAVGTAILNMTFSAMAGFALSRLHFRGREIIIVLTLAVMMIPIPVIIIPKFLVMNSLGLLNSYWALIIPVMAQPFSVFLMVQFMRSIPRELEESAMIDGASYWTIFRQIILPLVKPALVAVVILSFQNAWNDFLWPLLVLSGNHAYTLTVGMFYFKNAYYTQYNLLIAGSMFNTLPMVLLFFIFQRYFIEGATGSAVKG